MGRDAHADHTDEQLQLTQRELGAPAGRERVPVGAEMIGVRVDRTLITRVALRTSRADGALSGHVAAEHSRQEMGRIGTERPPTTSIPQGSDRLPRSGLR